MWAVNLRVYPPKKLDLRVAGKSTTSPLPDYGSVIPHDWYMSFEKFGGLPTVVAFLEN